MSFWILDALWPSFFCEGNHQCHPLPSDVPKASMYTAWQIPEKRQTVLQHDNAMAPHHSPVWAEDCQHWLETSPPSTLQFWPRPPRITSVWVYKGSAVAVKPALWKQYGSQGSCPSSSSSSFANCWNAVLLQGNLKTSRIVAKMQWLEFCTWVNSVDRSDKHPTQILHALIIFLICAKCPAYHSNTLESTNHI